jgi:hypothetical protein
MQRQMASFIASHGGAIVVTDESTMVQEVAIEAAPPVSGLTEKSTSKTVKQKKPVDGSNRLETMRGFDKSAPAHSYE